MKNATKTSKKTATKNTVKVGKTASKTVKQQVKALLNKKWVDHTVVQSTVTGDGMRRLRELRSEGVNVIKRYNKNTGTFQYRIK